MKTVKTPTQGGFYHILDLALRVDVVTETSVCLLVARATHEPASISKELRNLLLDNPDELLFEGIGWIDLHYPCQGATNVLLRMNIPEEYHESSRLVTIIHELISIFSIPSSETYAAFYFYIKDPQCILQPITLSGVPNQFLSL